MKIIGASTGGFILEASEEEVAHIMGADSWAALVKAAQAAGRLSDEGVRPRTPKVGDSIDIDTMWPRLAFFRDAHPKLKSFAENLRKVAAFIGEEIAPALAPPGDAHRVEEALAKKDEPSPF